MKAAVRYHSRSGNTKQLAQAIAGAVGAEALAVPAALDAPVDILFLGGGIYAGKMDKELTDYALGLTPEQAPRVVIFSTYARKAEAREKLAGLLTPKGIVVEQVSFDCPGKFLLAHRGHPDAMDLLRAAEFARGFLS